MSFKKWALTQTLSVRQKLNEINFPKAVNNCDKLCYQRCGKTGKESRKGRKRRPTSTDECRFLQGPFIPALDPGGKVDNRTDQSESTILNLVY